MYKYRAAMFVAALQAFQPFPHFSLSFLPSKTLASFNSVQSNTKLNPSLMNKSLNISFKYA